LKYNIRKAIIGRGELKTVSLGPTIKLIAVDVAEL